MYRVDLLNCNGDILFGVARIESRERVDDKTIINFGRVVLYRKNLEENFLDKFMVVSVAENFSCECCCISVGRVVVQIEHILLDNLLAVRTGIKTIG